MEKALLLTGKIETSEGSQESYQLMVDCDYIHGTYDGSNERILFYEELSAVFVERILKESFPLEIGVFNGIRINPQTGSKERLPKLENNLVSQFSEAVCSKLRHLTIRAISDPSVN